MKKIVVIMMILIIPLITVEKVNNKNYYLETETNTYTKEEIDNKINELLTKINDNTTKITETKNILIEIKNKLNDYALKTSLNKTNEDIESLLTLANQNKTRIDDLENSISAKGYYNIKLSTGGRTATNNSNAAIVDLTLPNDGFTTIETLSGSKLSGNNYWYLYGIDSAGNIVTLFDKNQLRNVGVYSIKNTQLYTSFKFYAYSTDDYPSVSWFFSLY